MTTIKTSYGCMSTVTYHPEVPLLRIPKIKGSKIIGGVKHYIGFDGKKYVSELFDRMFKTNY